MLLDGNYSVIISPSLSVSTQHGLYQESYLNLQLLTHAILALKHLSILLTYHYMPYLGSSLLLMFSTLKIHPQVMFFLLHQLTPHPLTTHLVRLQLMNLMILILQELRLIVGQKQLSPTTFIYSEMYNGILKTFHPLCKCMVPLIKTS